MRHDEYAFNPDSILCRIRCYDCITQQQIFWGLSLPAVHIQKLNVLPVIFCKIIYARSNWMGSICEQWFFSSINLSVGCISVVCLDNFSTSICFDNCSCSDYISACCLDRKRASAPGSILVKVTQVSLHDSSALHQSSHQLWLMVLGEPFLPSTAFCVHSKHFHFVLFCPFHSKNTLLACFQQWLPLFLKRRVCSVHQVESCWQIVRPELFAIMFHFVLVCHIQSQ